MSSGTQTQGGDWREAMMRKADAASSMLRTRERARNPFIPDNFLDVSGAGFPADIMVLSVQIPRAGNSLEQQQYRNMINAGWLHVPWEAISANGGNDGKANVPAAERHDIGGGEAVATLAGHFLMFAQRKGYEERRKRNVAERSRHLEYKMNEMEEKSEGGRRFAQSESSGAMSVEELLEFEERIGDEPALRGEHVS